MEDGNSIHFSGCAASPSRFPALYAGQNSSGFRLLSRQTVAAGDRNRRWWNNLRRSVKEAVSSQFCSHKQVTFGYDAASYAKNFDDGGNDCGRRIDDLDRSRVKAC